MVSGEASGAWDSGRALLVFHGLCGLNATGTALLPDSGKAGVEPRPGPSSRDPARSLSPADAEQERDTMALIRAHVGLHPD